jgi:hypothetical protein
VLGVTEALAGGRPFKFLQDRGQTFRDGLLDGIQRGPERSPECQQPRHPTSPDLRIHIATFDADMGNGEDYNELNCLTVQHYFARNPETRHRYWCEPGRYRKRQK